MQGHIGSSNTLKDFHKSFYAPNFAPKIQSYGDNCQSCIRTTYPCQKICIRPPLERIYDPCDGPEHIMEIDLVNKLPNSNEYSYVLMVGDIFSRYLLAVPLRKPENTYIVRSLLQIFTQQAYVPKHIITDKETACTKKSWMGSSTHPALKLTKPIWNTRKPSKAEKVSQNQCHRSHTAKRPIRQQSGHSA